MQTIILYIILRKSLLFSTCQGKERSGSKIYTEQIPWSRVLPEKLTGPQLVTKFPALYETQRFITAFTTAIHLSLF
jgi:hypothetical protein